MNIDHRNCDHDATPKARAACRKAHAEAIRSRQVLIADLIEVFNEDTMMQENHWVWYAARRFARYEGDNLNDAADAILTHFYPSGNEETDNHRRANGYIITESHYHMLQITRRAAS